MLIKPLNTTVGFDDLAPQSRGIVGLYPFWEGSGDRLTDLSINKNHGDLINGPVWVGSEKGFALKFDGVNDYVSILNPFTLTEFTYAALVLREDEATFHNFFGGGSNTRCFGGNGNGDFTLNADEGGSVNWVDALTVGIWQSVVVAYKTSTAELWIDGVSQGTKSLVDKSFVFEFIGANQAAAIEWKGLMADVRIYNRVILEREVKQYNFNPNGIYEI